MNELEYKELEGSPLSLNNFIQIIEKAADNRLSGEFLWRAIEDVGFRYIHEHFINPFLENDSFLFSSVHYYICHYPSIDAKGKDPKTLTGLLIVPGDEYAVKNKFPGTNVALMGFQHGTQIDRLLAPSCFILDAVKALQFVEVLIATIYALHGGYIIAMPDYQGMGIDYAAGFPLHGEDQPYMVGYPKARAAADFLLAVKKKISEFNKIWNNQLFLTGYSEGGYVTMMATRELEENSLYADEFTLTASAPLAGPYSVSKAMRNVMLRDEQYGDGFFLPMTVRGYRAHYGDAFDHGIFTKEKAYQKKYQQSPCDLDNLADGYHKYSDVNKAMPAVPRLCLSETVISRLSETGSTLWQVFRKNDFDFCSPDKTVWRPVVPIQMYHDPDDDRVPYENSVIAHEYFKTHGCEVPLVPVFAVPMGSCIHVEAGLPAFLLSYKWFQVFRHSHANQLRAGDLLVPGGELLSSNRKYLVRFQLDGNLAIYQADSYDLVWHRESEEDIENNPRPGRCMLQADGDVVIYSLTGDIMWHTDTGNPPKKNCTLQLENNGKLVLYDSTHNPVWSVPE